MVRQYNLKAEIRCVSCTACQMKITIEASVDWWRLVFMIGVISMPYNLFLNDIIGQKIHGEKLDELPRMGFYLY